MKTVPAFTLIAMGALVALVRPVSASCENIIQAQSRELWFIFNAVYPGEEFPRTAAEDSLYAVEQKPMWDAMARGLATAVACQRRIESDARLAAVLRESPVYLQMGPGGPLRPESETYGKAPPVPDSLFAIFAGLASDSTAQLYSARIGLFADSASAHRVERQLGWLMDLRESGAEWDSTKALDWVHEDCSIGEYERPTLFVLPPGASGTGRWALLSGLFYSSRDASHWAVGIRDRGEATVKVVPIRVTGDVLALAIPPH